jgi:hypothetical protein
MPDVDKLPRKLLNVFTVGVYWRNDQPGGIGFTYDMKDGGIEFCEEIERTMPAMDISGITAERVTCRLRELALYGSDMNRRQAIECILNVHWLQTRGHLKPDEFNGTLFGCRFDEEFIAFSERNPVTITDHNVHVMDVTDIAKAAGKMPLSKGNRDALRVATDYGREQAKKKR